MRKQKITHNINDIVQKLSVLMSNSTGADKDRLREAINHLNEANICLAPIQVEHDKSLPLVKMESLIRSFYDVEKITVIRATAADICKDIGVENTRGNQMLAAKAMKGLTNQKGFRSNGKNYLLLPRRK